MSNMFKQITFGLAFAAVSAIPAIAMTDAEFLKQAVKGDNSEVELGRLAVQKASSPGVKTFAQTLIDDHTKAKAQAVALASQHGVAPTDDVSAEAKQEYAKLQPLSGAAFDKAFVSYMVDDHKKDIADFKGESTSGKGPVQNLASEQLPTLQKHLDMAQSLASKS